MTKVGFASAESRTCLRDEGALKALAATGKENGIRVPVTGRREGDAIRVQTLKIG